MSIPKDKYGMIDIKKYRDGIDLHDCDRQLFVVDKKISLDIAWDMAWDYNISKKRILLWMIQDKHQANDSEWIKEKLYFRRYWYFEFAIVREVS